MQIMLLDKRVKYLAINNNSFAFSFKYIDGYKITIETKDINEAILLFFTLTKNIQIGTPIYLQTEPLLPLLEALVELLNMSVHAKLVRMYNKIIK